MQLLCGIRHRKDALRRRFAWTRDRLLDQIPSRQAVCLRRWEGDVKISGWGRFPVVDAEVIEPQTVSEFRRTVLAGTPSIPRGLGRSYGDSALWSRVMGTRRLDYFKAFD